ncbi:MAG: CotH kinase family protein [Paludibaculum sp.]
MWLSNMDSLLSMGQNYYVYLNPQSNRFLFLPWDLDHSFGQFPMGGSTELSIQRPWQGQNRFLERVFQVEEFKKHYLARLSEINRTLGEPGRISKQVDETAALIRPAVKEESAEKLARFEKAVSGQQLEPAGFPGGDMGPGGPGGGPGEGPGGRMGPRMGGMKPIKGFVGPRSQSVAAQLSGKSQGQTNNGPGGRGGFGGPGGMGPAMFLAPAFQQAMGSAQNAPITREQFTRRSRQVV